MSDHIDRAAEIIYVEVLGLPDYDPDAVDDHNRHSYRGDCDCNASDRAAARHTAEELDSAGLLATPEHDAAVAARAWSEGFTTGQSRAMRHMSDEPLLPLSAPNPYEREAGESGADA